MKQRSVFLRLADSFESVWYSKSGLVVSKNKIKKIFETQAFEPQSHDLNLCSENVSF